MGNIKVQIKKPVEIFLNGLQWPLSIEHLVLLSEYDGDCSDQPSAVRLRHPSAVGQDARDGSIFIGAAALNSSFLALQYLVVQTKYTTIEQSWTWVDSQNLPFLFPTRALFGSRLCSVVL